MRAFKRVLLAVSLLLTAAGAVPAAGPSRPLIDPSKSGTVTGQLASTEGVPLAEGVAHFFNDASGPPPSQDRYWRVPDFMRRLDRDGRFTVQLPEGRYYFGAIKRLSGANVGPPRQGDLFFISADAQGMPKAYDVKAGQHLELGRLPGAVPFRGLAAGYGSGITAIEGSVLDAEGRPVENAHVFAFVSAAAVGRPLFVAEPTGKDGKFILRVADGGSYFLKVRSAYGGGPPVAGETVGSFGEKAPAAVTVKKGERVRNIVITVVKFAGRGPQAAAKPQPAAKPPLAAPPSTGR